MNNVLRKAVHHVLATARRKAYVDGVMAKVKALQRVAAPAVVTTESLSGALRATRR